MESKKYWPHAPMHRFEKNGTYMVTGATYLKQPFFKGRDRLQHVQETLFKQADDAGFELQSWAIFANHYHFIASAAENGDQLGVWLGKFHSDLGRYANYQDATKGRKVMYNFWDTLITNQRSYFARLRYVNQNAAHHGVVQNSLAYPWCSAAWFEKTGNRSFVATVKRFPIDKLKIRDDF